MLGWKRLGKDVRMSDRHVIYSDLKLGLMKDIITAITVLTQDGTLFEFLRGKQLFLRDEIARELKLREQARKEAEAAAAPEPVDEGPTQKNENPPT